jgi:hypothetical protein
MKDTNEVAELKENQPDDAYILSGLDENVTGGRKFFMT